MDLYRFRAAPCWSFAFETLDGSQVYIDDIKVELAAPPHSMLTRAVAALTWTRTGGPLGGLGYDIRMMLVIPIRCW